MKEQDKDKFSSPMAKGTCYFLIYLTGIYPINSAVAGGITPDNPKTQVHNNGNVPVVNIAAPNNAGISHNTYKEFNTGTQGAVLNNAAQAVKSQLAGQINANANLHGKAAELIINEVTGSSRSELLGQLEVAGKKANVMIANPNGITCNGCGFINTSGAVLTTGKPQFDKQGALEALKVTKGQITIGGKGLNGQSTDYVDIISRATEINGKIQANNLALTQGANQISFKDGTAKTIAGEGSRPQLAVDTKALGGMYANKIRLIATENGVGVNLKNITSNQRDITLSANGKMELGNIKAKTDLNVGAKEINIEPNIPVQAERDIILAGNKITNKGNVIAGQDMRVYGDTVSNTGAQALLPANNNMWIQKNVEGDKNKEVINKGKIKTNSGDLIVRSENITNGSDDLEVRSNVTLNKKLKQGMFGPEFTDKPRQYGAYGYPQKLGHTEINIVKKPQTAVIESGKSAYLYGDNIFNKYSNISAKDNLILTGKNFESKAFWGGSLQRFADVGYFKDNIILWSPTHSVGSSLQSKNNLVFDFKNKVDIKTEAPNELKGGRVFVDHNIFYDKLPLNIKANNITINSKDIDINNSGLEANKDVNIISENIFNADSVDIKSGNDISAISNFLMKSTNLKSKNIFLKSVDGNIQLYDGGTENFYGNGSRRQNKLEAYNDLTLSAGKKIYLNNVSFAPISSNISMFAKDDIIIESEYITDTHRNFIKEPSNQPYGYEISFEKLIPITKLKASNSILMSSGKDISLVSVILNANKDVTLNSRQDLEVTSREYRSISGNTISSPDELKFSIKSDDPKLRTQIHAGENLLVNVSNDINSEGAKFSAGKTVSLLAGNSLNLLSAIFPVRDGWNKFLLSGWFGNQSKPYNFKNSFYDFVRTDVPAVTDVNAGKNIILAAGNTITTEGSKISSGQNVNISSGGDIKLKASRNYFYDFQKRQERITRNVTELTSGGSLNIYSEGSILFEATKLFAKGLGANWKSPIQLSNWSSSLISAESQVKEVERNLHIYQQNRSPLQAREEKLKSDLKEKEISIESIKNSDVPAGFRNILSSLIDGVIESKLDIEKELNELTAQLKPLDSKINHAKNILNNAKKQLSKIRQEAQTKGVSEARQKSEVDAYNRAEATRNGTINIAAKGGYLYAAASDEIKNFETINEVRYGTNNKVSEFIASGNINILSRDDSTYEASKIQAGKNITLTSTHGSVNFKAAKNIEYERKLSTSESFFIKTKDKGYSSEKWILPQLGWNGNFIVDAATGINADIKVRNGQALQNAINFLGNNPETSWIKDINKRNNVQWAKVKDAYDSWDKSKKSLHPMAGAIIAVVVTAVTAGYAAPAAGAVAGGSAVAQGAVTAGMAALASKAAVSLIENEGNLSKTFKDLGNSDTVKSIITSMAIGGALSGFEQAMGWTAANAASSTNSNLPLLSKGDWIKTAQRVVGQSVISSSLNTAINGGSFKDNFATALLANAGNQINAEGANLVGDNGQVLGVPGKMISHAAVSALAAEIGGGNAKGAAAGALAASLAATVLQETFSDPAKVQAGGKIIGGIAGAFATNNAQGVNSGANSGEITIVYNHLAHALSMMEKEIPGTIKAHEESRKKLCAQSPDVCKMAASTLSFGADFVPIFGDFKSFAEAETATDYLASIIGLVPVIGDLAGQSIKGANTALKHGDLEVAKKLINQARDEISSAGLFKRSTFDAPSGNNYTVFQQPINWDLPVNTKEGIKTNLEVALGGKSPFVVKDGKYSQINLHHSKQNGLGPLFELSADTHERYRWYDALHPHLPSAHPVNPVNRELFDTDRKQYWIHRAETELKKK